MIHEKSEGSASMTSSIGEASSELQEYLSVSHQRHRLFPRAALVGLCAGIVAIVFRGIPSILLELGESFVDMIVNAGVELAESNSQEKLSSHSNRGFGISDV